MLSGPGPSPPARRSRIEAGLVGLTRWVLRRPVSITVVSVLAGVGLMFAQQALVVDHALMDQFDESDPIAQATGILEERLEGVRPLEVLLEADDETRSSSRRPSRCSTMPSVVRVRGRRARRHRLRRLPPRDLVAPHGEPAARAEPFADREQTEALRTLLLDRDLGGLERFLTADRRTARLRVMLADTGSEATIRFVEGLEERLAPLAEHGVQHRYAGHAYTGSVGTRAVIRDLRFSLSTAVVIIFVLLVGLFRSVRLGILSILPNLLPLVGAMTWMVLRGIPLNLATAITFSISLGLAVDGSIHVLARYREEHRPGVATSVALVRAARGTGRAIVISCLTLAVRVRVAPVQLLRAGASPRRAHRGDGRALPGRDPRRAARAPQGLAGPPREAS